MTDNPTLWLVQGIVLNKAYPQCVNSGYCCKQAACPYGEWDEEKHQCAFLEGDRPGEYRCGIYREIRDLPGSREISPAFGAGCSSNLNDDRMTILKEMRDAGTERADSVPKHGIEFEV